jgi:ribosomal protein L37AE/L43A
MTETPATGGDDPNAYADETTTTAEAVCPACGSEAAEQVHETHSIYNCRECGAEFDASGGGQLIE